MPRLADRLRARAAERFVGRATELSLIEDSFVVDPPLVPVFIVHGPGGIGKTTLLERARTLAAGHGIDSLRVDARDLQASPAALLCSLGSALGLEDKAASLPAVIERWSLAPRRLLVIDTFERIANLDRWLREVFLPELPDRSVVLIAGRAAPDPAWTTDPLWREGARVIALGKLAPADCARLLAARGVKAEHHDGAARLSYGHPLALTLLADELVARGTMPEQLGADVVRRLVERFTADAPSALHRRALEACAVARVTTEALLAEVVDRDRARELFDWLAALSFVEAGADGLFPHDLARDAIDDDLYLRQRDRHRELRSSISRHLTRCIDSGIGPLAQVAFDIFFLMRRGAVMRGFVDFGALGSTWFERSGARDAAALRPLLAAELAPGEAALFDHWLVHSAATTWVMRPAPRQVSGATLLIDLERLSDHERAADPVCDAVWRALQQVAPPHPGDLQLLARWSVAAGGQRRASAAMNALQVSHCYQWLAEPRLGAFVLCVEAPDHWLPMMQRTRFERLAGCDFEFDGVPHGCYLHDFRAEPLARYFQAMRTPRADWTAAAALSRQDFEQAVRDALKVWHDPAALAANPLASCHAVQAAATEGEAPATTLQRLLIDHARSLQDRPRDARFWRALELTFFRPAGTQELAAERLGLPFGTYRYQLATGIGKLAARLWALQSG